MYSGSSVLVTGAAGFLGTNFILNLLDREAKVFATYHRSEPQICDSKVSFSEADLTHYEDCLRVVSGKDFVVMCAGVTGGARLLESNQTAMAIQNLIMNTYTLQAAFEARVKRVLFFSGGTVYPLCQEACEEKDSTFNFYDKYFAEGWSKRFSEVLAEILQRDDRYGTEVVVIRPGNIYGPYDNFSLDKGHVIPALIEKCLSAKSFLDVWGSGDELRDFIYIDDFVKGALLAFRDMPAFEPLNIASGRVVSIREVAEKIIKLTGRSIKIRLDGSQPTMIPRQAFDVSKAELLLGFEATTSLEEGLSRTIQWRERRRSI
jgi:GDP-L-fucose synthase